MATYIQKPFAINGDITEIPADTTLNGAVSFQQGYTQYYELDPATDHLAQRIERSKMNYLFNTITANTKEWQEQTFPAWISDSGSGTPFGYQIGAIVKYTDGKFYQSITDNNTEPPTNNTNWQEFKPLATATFLPTIKVFNTAGSYTWTKPEGVKTIKVYVTGGGGSGGTNNLANSQSSGGGAGGTSIKIIDVTNVSEVSLTVGAGGAGNSSYEEIDGNNGGTSSFGSYCSATGGYGGFRTSPFIASARGGAGGKGIGGDLNLTGGPGQSGSYSVTNTVSAGGSGGNSFWGGGGAYTSYAGYPTNGVQGGGGAGSFYYGTHPNDEHIPNSSGGDGIIIIEEYI